MVDQNTIKIVCSVPQGSSSVNENIKEIYIYAKDSLNNDFLFALGQPTETIRYDKDGSTSLELQISLVNVDLIDNITFNNTQATELAEHEANPNSHIGILKALSDHGIYVPASAYNFKYQGQSIEYPVEFDGVKASFTHSGVTFTATYNGNEINGKTISFDGSKTTDQLRAEFNAANYPDTVEHDGSGSEILPIATKTFTGGVYVVDDGDFVYKDSDGIYKQALADGTSKSHVVGWVVRSEKMIVTSGMIALSSSYAVNTPFYLSGTQAGKITDFNTNISLGLVLASDHAMFTGFAGDISTSVSQEFDAVVADSVGLGQYQTTQAAINAIPNNGRILVSKLELVKETIHTSSKNFTVTFNNHECGWKRFLGQGTEFHIGFSAVPTQGTFRFEWSGQESNDIPWNASASLVQEEFNLFNGHNGVSVVGNFTDGFTFTFLDNQYYDLPTFIYAGRNEIQSFSFSAVPDNGTFRLSFKGQETVNYAFNDSLEQLQAALDNLSTTKQLVVTGDFSTGFTIEFTGGYLQDGNQEQPLIDAVTNWLYNSGLLVSINGSSIAPISAHRVQSGKKPASNLYNGTSLLDITITSLQVGEQPGPDRLFEVENSALLISGNGRVEGFTEGFNLASSVSKLQFQGYFSNVEKPFLTLNKLPGIHTDINAFGYHKDINAQLRLSEHPTNKKRVIVSEVDFTLPNGVTLIKEINKLKMKFTGAEIDFSTGTIYESDGATLLGTAFTVPAISPTYWKWFSVNLTVSGINPLTNEAEIYITVLPSDGEGTTKDLAPKPYFDKTPIGLVAIQGALGVKEQTVITTVKDSVTHRLAGKTFILYHPTESVAFYFKNGSTIPALALTANRQVEINTILPDDFQATVAQKIKAAIDADAKFEATVSTNRVTVTNSVLGSVTDADMGDTGFFSSVLVQGTNTDSTGIEDISNSDISQLALGSGGSGGTGTGDASSFTENLKHRLNTSFYNEAASIVISVDENTYIDNSSTAKYKNTDGVYEFKNVGEQVITTNLFSDDFYSNTNSVNKLEVYADWDGAYYSYNSLYYASLDGGVNYSPITMSKQGSSSLFAGEVTVTDSIVEGFFSSEASGFLPLNSTNYKSFAVSFGLSSKSVITQLEIPIKKTGSPQGSIAFKIYKVVDNGSGEQPVDTVYYSSQYCPDLSSGESVVTINLKRVLVSGNYWISIEGDSTYRSSYTTGNKVELKGASFTEYTSYEYNTSWSFSDFTIGATVSGYTYDLRLKIESTEAPIILKAFGVLYDEELSGSLPDVVDNSQIFVFSGSENKRTFTITKFLPDATKLKVYDVNTGQVYIYPAFMISGYNVVFPSGTFSTSASDTITLKFEQIYGSGFDYSTTNLSLLVENHLGSNDATMDKSVSGRGILQRDSAGALKEVWIDAFGNLNITAPKG